MRSHSRRTSGWQHSPRPAMHTSVVTSAPVAPHHRSEVPTGTASDGRRADSPWHRCSSPGPRPLRASLEPPGTARAAPRPRTCPRPSPAAEPRRSSGSAGRQTSHPPTTQRGAASTSAWASRTHQACSPLRALDVPTPCDCRLQQQQLLRSASCVQPCTGRPLAHSAGGRRADSTGGTQAWATPMRQAGSLDH